MSWNWSACVNKASDWAWNKAGGVRGQPVIIVKVRKILGPRTTLARTEPPIGNGPRRALVTSSAPLSSVPNDNISVN